MAELALEDGKEFTDSICFHCQQCAEKMMKAYLIKKDIGFTKTHSLSYLLDLISNKEKITEELYSLAEVLEDYADGVRYPGESFEPTYENAMEAFNTVKEIMLIFKQKISEN